MGKLVLLLIYPFTNSLPAQRNSGLPGVGLFTGSCHFILFRTSIFTEKLGAENFETIQDPSFRIVTGWVDLCLSFTFGEGYTVLKSVLSRSW